VILSGVGSSFTWVVGAAGAVVIAHASAMATWGVHDVTTALIVDMTAGLLATSIIANANGDPIPALLTYVGGAVLIALFSSGWVRVGIAVYLSVFTLVTLVMINDGDLTVVIGDFIGSLFVVVLIIALTSVITARLTEVEAARAQTIGVVSHELRNHLAGIVGATELVRDPDSGLDEAETNEFLQLAYQQAVEAGEVIDDLLIASRAERGVLDALPELVDLVPLTGTVIQRTSVESGAILSDFPDDPVWAVADPLRYKQIMRNLLTNAFRYGGDAIRVSLATLGDTVSVVVADNGEGVDPSDETAIFQPYRGGKSIEQVPGSTGLGLWIARSLAHKMGGNVSYRRQSGQTVFELTLPAGPVPDVVDDPAWLSTSSAH
jgi:signal transduction histidine kinase